MPRILITRSPLQASELADRLRALGADPLLIPAIEIAEPTSFAALDAALAKLDTFHWLLFTSANAVEAFHRRFDSPQIGSPQIRVPHVSILRRGSGSPRVAAIGPSTARALEAIGLTPGLIPSQAVAESLADALLPYARQPEGSPTRFLLVRAESVGDTPPREHLPETLRAAGAEVTIAPAYRTLIPTDSIPAIRTLFGSSQIRVPHLRGRAADAKVGVDAITFTSSSTVHNLLALCHAAGVALPPQPLRISIGPITSQTLREAGLPPHAESPQATVATLAEIVVKTLKTRQNP